MDFTLRLPARCSWGRGRKCRVRGLLAHKHGALRALRAAGHRPPPHRSSPHTEAPSVGPPAPSFTLTTPQGLCPSPRSFRAERSPGQARNQGLRGPKSGCWSSTRGLSRPVCLQPQASGSLVSCAFPVCSSCASARVSCVPGSLGPVRPPTVTDPEESFP